VKTPKRQTGDIGEDVACKYLQNKGFSLLERNYLRKWGEIDIVAERAKKLYFIEVKTVTTPSSGAHDAGRESRHVPRGTYRPEENVHPAKLMRLHRAIQTYLLDHKVPEDKEWQIDIASVYLNMDTRKAHVEMLENVIL
jgi:putative endonuclease